MSLPWRLQGRGPRTGCSGAGAEAQVAYSCSSCPAEPLCGWCLITCHPAPYHRGKAELQLQGSHTVPWAAYTFRCTCCGVSPPVSPVAYSPLISTTG